MNKKPIVRVREVMKSEFDVVEGMDTIQDALNNMKYVETKALIVKKRHEDDEHGVVFISDIAREVLAEDCSPDRMNIYEVMIKPTITVSPDMNIRYCCKLFKRFGISRSLVVDNDQVVGIVSFTDMVLRGMRSSS